MGITKVGTWFPRGEHNSPAAGEAAWRSEAERHGVVALEELPRNREAHPSKGEQALLNRRRSFTLNNSASPFRNEPRKAHTVPAADRAVSVIWILPDLTVPFFPKFWEQEALRAGQRQAGHRLSVFGWTVGACVVSQGSWGGQTRQPS